MPKSTGQRRAISQIYGKELNREPLFHHFLNFSLNDDDWQFFPKIIDEILEPFSQAG
jgi:hypothetical protein